MSDNKISLNEAMGVTRNMTPKQVSERWKDWSNKYPKEKEKLGYAVIASYEALYGIITAYDTVSQSIAGIEDAIKMAIETYNTAMLMVPGLGTAAGSKTLVQKSGDMLKKAMEFLAKKMNELPQILYDLYEKAANTKVDEEAIL